MITRTIDPGRFNQEARHIRACVPAILSKWGLPPKFSRWRLTQDPETGLAVLFAVLNSKYIAAHTSIPFSDYFDPRLLNDLASGTNVQVVSCNSDGLRYAFILDRGALQKIPTHIDFPILDGERVLVGVVYQEESGPGWIDPQAGPARPVHAETIDDRTLVDQGVGAFLKVFDDIQQRGDIAARLSAQKTPSIVVMDNIDFNKRVMEHDADQQRVKRFRKLIGDSDSR
jgi:hypothetical protein